LFGEEFLRTFVRIDRAKRKIFRRNTRFSENIEKSRFSEGEKKRTKILSTEQMNGTNPAFGRPTIPIFKFVPTRPINGFGLASSFFFGGIETLKMFCFFFYLKKKNEQTTSKY
jgi:hypothetical protein